MIGVKNKSEVSSVVLSEILLNPEEYTIKESDHLILISTDKENCKKIFDQNNSEEIQTSHINLEIYINAVNQENKCLDKL